MTASAAATTAKGAHKAPQTPQLDQARPETIGLSPVRLQAMSDAFKREIDKGSIPGVTVLVSRRGHIGWFEALGRQAPGSDAPMRTDSLFRIFSMTKPITSVAAMMLVEQGKLALDDEVGKYIHGFYNIKVGVEKAGPDGKPAWNDTSNPTAADANAMGAAINVIDQTSRAQKEAATAGSSTMPSAIKVPSAWKPATMFSTASARKR